MAILNILTLNKQGLNSPTKFTKAFCSFSAHVVFLQEMHFSTHSTPKFFGKQYSQVSVSASTQLWKVLVEFHCKTPFTLQAETRVPEGRYLILTGLLLGSKITIVLYYAPNKKPLLFLSHLLSVVASHRWGTLLICGNSNQVIYPLLDSSPSLTTAHGITYQLLLNQYSLLDSWREQNSSQTTVHLLLPSHPHRQFSRIDHILVSVGTSPLILT